MAKRRLVSEDGSSGGAWGELVRADRKQAAAEIARLTSKSTAGIGVAASPDDPAMLTLFADKMEATLDYAVGYTPRASLSSAADRVDSQARLWLEGGHVKLAEAGA